MARCYSLLVLLLTVVACTVGPPDPVAPTLGLGRPQATHRASLVLDVFSEPVFAEPKAGATPQRAATLPPPRLTVAAANAPSPPPSMCAMPSDADLPPGFYASDEWPKGQVVLTFDDGPHPTITPRVLDILDEHQLPATFFLVGAAIRTNTYRLVQRMVREGHTLGSHTYNHDIGMATRRAGPGTVEYIRGQHEVTQVLIELALLAESGQHFEALFARVFEDEPNRYLSSAKIRNGWRDYVARHRALLEELGKLDDRPYPIVYSRPPGGIPYLRQSATWSREAYDKVLTDLGWLNVMWHAGSGDTDPDRRQDYGFLTNNLRLSSRRGGILLIHDYIRRDALRAALTRMVEDPSVEVVSIETALQRKYQCGRTAWSQLARASRELDG